MEATIERTGIATIGGNDITLVGPELHVGDSAPAFTVNKDLLTEVSLKDYQGKIKLVSVIPSVDTGPCSLQTRRFNQEASNLGDNVVILTISADLPFAQARFCGAAGIDRVELLSDYKFHSFARAYGVLVKEVQLCQRAVFIIDDQDIIRYVQIVKELTQEPDYDDALHALRALSK